MLVSPSFNALAVTFHIFFQCREEIFLSRFMTPDGEDFFGSKVCGKREFHEVVQQSFYKFGSHPPERWHCRGCIGRYKVDVAFYESHWWERSANIVITFWAACPKATCVLRFVNLVVGYFIILLRPELGLPYVCSFIPASRKLMRFDIVELTSLGSGSSTRDYFTRMFDTRLI